MLKVYNTLSRKKEEFVPQDPPNVKMYVCGITPYDECHVGHARCYVVFDVIRRYLEYRGFKVNYAQNFTDIDDKIINRAKESLASSPVKPVLPVKDKVREIAERYIADYFTQMDALNVRRADEYPKVTEHIKEIVEVVKVLLDKGYAYTTEQGVYFDVAKFTEYGKLSHRAKEELMPGARVEVDEKKKDPLDFALWKAAKEDEPSWDSPWGKGRPGWHIECSVMSMDHLGSSTLDIHGGGQDLIFPHHENEIAQSEACTGKPFVKYWMHNGFITINKEKMSKSLGNFFTIREILEKYNPIKNPLTYPIYNPVVLRLFLLSAHYRQPMDFCYEELNTAWNELERMRIFKNSLKYIINLFNNNDDSKNINNKEIKEFELNFITAMDDDFNIPNAIGAIHCFITEVNILIDKINVSGKPTKEEIAYFKNADYLFDKLMNVLGLEITIKSLPKLTDEVTLLISEREKARRNKDWATADKIRKELQKKGIRIEDTPFGTKVA